MAWTLEFATEAEADFELIFDHLFESYIAFGESAEEAFDRAATRIVQIRRDAERILTAPKRGETHDDLLSGSRNLTIGKASYWFVADDEAESVTVLAVFYGGQDQVRRMMLRVLSEQ